MSAKLLVAAVLIAASAFGQGKGKGTVVRYSPTRMTEERLSSAIEDLLR